MTVGKSLRPADIPLHRQIAQLLRLRLEAGEWEVNGSASTEQGLCNEFGVSRTTVRQALSRLKEEGLVESRRGVGTRSILIGGNRRVVRSVGDPLHGSFNSHPSIVSAGEVPAPPQVSSFFKADPGERMFQLVRLHVLDDGPLSVVISYLRSDNGRQLPPGRLREPLFDLLWDCCGIRIKRSVHTLRVARADATVASLLNIAIADPVLRVQSLGLSAGGDPIRWTENFFKEDRYEYSAEMEWPDPPEDET